MKPRAADVACVELVTGPAPGGPVAGCDGSALLAFELADPAGARLLIWSET